MASVTDRAILEIDEVNPMGTDGFEFVEYTAPDPAALGVLFESMGFTKVAKHRSKDVSLYRQGDVNFIVNAEKESVAQGFARVHGPSVCAIALPVQTLSLDNYALALSMPSRRFQDRLPLLREALAQAKRSIETAAGVT
jgi:4-hydroxyphenylpyruvate dioxygenase